MSSPLENSLSEDMYQNIQNISPLPEDQILKPKIPKTSLSDIFLKSLKTYAQPVPNGGSQASDSGKTAKRREPRRSYAAAIAQLQSPTPMEAALVAEKAGKPVDPGNVAATIATRQLIAPPIIEATASTQKRYSPGRAAFYRDARPTAGLTEEKSLSKTSKMDALSTTTKTVKEREAEDAPVTSSARSNPGEIIISDYVGKAKAARWDEVVDDNDINKKLFVHSTGRVKRPMNAFMIWGRRARAAVAKSMDCNCTNGEVSVRMGELWRAMSDEEKQPYYDEARKLAMYHNTMFPDYEYKPAEHNKTFGPVSQKREKSALWKAFCANGTLDCGEGTSGSPQAKKARLSEARSSRSAYWENFRRYGTVEGAKGSTSTGNDDDDDDEDDDDDDDLLPLSTTTPTSILKLGGLLNAVDDFPTMVPLSRPSLRTDLSTSPLSEVRPLVLVKNEPLSPKPEPEPEQEDGPFPVSLVKVKEEPEDWTTARSDDYQDDLDVSLEISVKDEPRDDGDLAENSYDGVSAGMFAIKDDVDSEDEKGHVKIREEWEDSETEAWNDDPDEKSFHSKDTLKRDRSPTTTDADAELGDSAETETPQFSIVCLRCGRGFETSAQLAAHMPIHGEYRAAKRYMCTRCAILFPDSVSFKRHQGHCVDEEPYFCDVCNRTFPESHSLMLHKRTHSVNIQKSDPYACLHCEAAFRTRHALLRHVRFHTGDKPYCCSLCKETFRSRDELWTHKNEAHSFGQNDGSEPVSLCWGCQFCSEEFTDSESFQKHLVTHTGLKPFKCEECGAEFSKSDQLNDHMETHK